MKCVEVTGFGGPKQLRIAERPLREPGADEVLVRVRSCGLNFADLLQREGNYPGGPVPPFVAGSEASGTVIARGSSVAKPKLGSGVCLLATTGLQATHAVVKATACHPLPAGMSFEAGAAFPIQFLTAYHALITLARVAAGETVLIHAAAGGVGSAAIQIARTLSLRVIGTASTAAKREWVRSLGAEAIPYQGFEKACRELNGDVGPDIVLDTVGGDVLERNLKLLPALGRLVLIGFSGGVSKPIDPTRLLFRAQTVMGFHLNAIVQNRPLLESSLAQLARWFASGRIQPKISQTFPLEEVAQAHRLLAGRESMGKLVLIP